MKNSIVRKNRSRRFTLETLETRQLLSTFTVNSAGDDLSGPVAGQVTLRDAITQANHVAGHNDIQFSVASISLSAPLPAITGDLAIQTSKTQHIQIWYDGDIGPVLTVANSATAEVDNLSITGNGSQGIQNAGNLTLKSDVFIVCATSGNGGAIYNSGTLNVTSSGFYGNSASLGGAIYNAGTLTQSGNVFYNNTGGDVYNQPVLTVHTVSYNVNLMNGPGLLSQFDPSLGTLTSVSYTGHLNAGGMVQFSQSGSQNAPWSIQSLFYIDGTLIDARTLSGTVTSASQSNQYYGGIAYPGASFIPDGTITPSMISYDSFVGTGTIPVLVSGSGLSISGSNVNGVLSSQHNGDVTVTYTYTTLS